jgi:hypothetical protein
VSDVAVKELYERRHVGDLVGGVVEHGVEGPSRAREGSARRAILTAVDVNAANPLGEDDRVAIGDRHLVASVGKFAHQAQPDVAVATQDQDSHLLLLSGASDDRRTRGTRKATRAYAMNERPIKREICTCPRTP